MAMWPDADVFLPMAVASLDLGEARERLEFLRAAYTEAALNAEGDAASLIDLGRQLVDAEVAVAACTQRQETIRSNTHKVRLFTLHVKRRLVLWLAWRLRAAAMRLNDAQGLAWRGCRLFLRRAYRDHPEYDYAIAGMHYITDDCGEPEPCANCRIELATEYDCDSVGLCLVCYDNCCESVRS